MRGERLFGLLFIFLEGFFEDEVEIGIGYGGFWRLGGRARSRRLTHDEGMIWISVIGIQVRTLFGRGKAFSTWTMGAQTAHVTISPTP